MSLRISIRDLIHRWSEWSQILKC